MPTASGRDRAASRVGVAHPVQQQGAQRVLLPWEVKMRTSSGISVLVATVASPRQDVSRLDVAVNDEPRVGVLYGIAHLVEQWELRRPCRSVHLVLHFYSMK
jgi:hypothetical protein